MKLAPAWPFRRRRSPGTASSCWLLLGILGLPPGLVYLGLADSTAPGMTLMCLLLLVAAGLLGARDQPTGMPLGRTLQVAMLLCGLIATHLIASALRVPVDLQRGLLSLIPLSLMVLAGSALASRLANIPQPSLHAGALAAYSVLCACALVGATGWGPPTLALEPWRRPVFPFYEPSAFALGFTPIALYAAVTSRGAYRLIVGASALVCMIVVGNLTLLCGLLLVALVALRLRWIVLGGALAAALLPQLELSYFTERLDLSGDGSNLSNLVYIQGWQMVVEAWDRSGGLGIGMQQLGVLGTDVPASYVVRALREGEDMNLLDGSFAFAKLGADFGALGFAAAALLLVLALRSCVALRRISVRKRLIGWPPAVLLAHCSVASFPIELFVRSAGYFTGAGLLLSGALWTLHATRQERSVSGRRRRFTLAPVH